MMTNIGRFGCYCVTIGSGLGILGCGAASVAASPNANSKGFRDVLTQPSGIHVWFAFDPANCALSSRSVAQINAIRLQPGVQVGGVLLRPPNDPAETNAVLAAFGVHFPIQVDSSGIWERWLQAGGYDTPFVAVIRGHRLVALGSLDLLPFTGSLVSESWSPDAQVL